MKLVVCNCPEDAAPELARTLVGERLAACVSLSGTTRSFYRWEGKIHEDDEVTLWIKTSSVRAPALRQRLAELHPYDVPEIVALPVEAASSWGPYLQWVDAMTEEQTP